jgi:two-component system LytT family response regulator
MIKCIAVDDEQHAIDLLVNHISKTPLLQLQAATTSPKEAFRFVKEQPVDLIFLDIHMAEMDGLQFLNLIDKRPVVVLTTAYAEHAIEGYEHDNIADYLLKPVTHERFLKAVQKAIKIFSGYRPAVVIAKSSEDEFIFVKGDSKNKIKKVLLRDIEYIESMGNYLAFYTKETKLIALSTMKELEKKLPSDKFIRIHNSFIIPIQKITAVEGNELSIGIRKLPIGGSYKKAFMEIIGGYILSPRK